MSEFTRITKARIPNRTFMLTLLWLTFATTALAQTPDGQSLPEEATENQASKGPARDAFNAGVAAYASGDYQQATAQFRHAYALHPSYVILFNIGQCEALLKRYGLAFEAFEQYLADGGDDITVSRRDEVFDELKRLKNLVGAVRVTAPRGAIIRIDGEKRGTAPLPGTLKIGVSANHTVEVIQNDRVIHTQIVKVSHGDTAVVTVDIATNPEPPPPDTSAVAGNAVAGKETSSLPDDHDTAASMTPSQNDVIIANEANKKRRLFAGISLGLGGALLIGGGITGAMALSANEELKSNCENRVCTSEDDKLTLEQKNTLASLSTGLVIAGIATAAIGIPFWVRMHRSKKKGAATNRIQVFPMATATGFGLTVTGGIGR